MHVLDTPGTYMMLGSTLLPLLQRPVMAVVDLDQQPAAAGTQEDLDQDLDLDQQPAAAGTPKALDTLGGGGGGGGVAGGLERSYDPGRRAGRPHQDPDPEVDSSSSSSYGRLDFRRMWHFSRQLQPTMLVYRTNRCAGRVEQA